MTTNASTAIQVASSPALHLSEGVLKIDFSVHVTLQPLNLPTKQLQEAARAYHGVGWSVTPNATDIPNSGEVDQQRSFSQCINPNMEVPMEIDENEKLEDYEEPMEVEG